MRSSSCQKGNEHAWQRGGSHLRTSRLCTGCRCVILFLLLDILGKHKQVSGISDAECADYELPAVSHFYPGRHCFLPAGLTQEHVPCLALACALRPSCDDCDGRGISQARKLQRRLKEKIPRFFSVLVGSPGSLDRISRGRRDGFDLNAGLSRRAGDRL